MCYCNELGFIKLGISLVRLLSIVNPDQPELTIAYFPLGCYNYLIQ